MEDRGEMIVTLARELLRSNLAPLPEPTPPHVALSFKTLLLGALLTAAGSSAITWITIEARQPLNRFEKTELDALVSYAARQKGLTEQDLRHDVLAKLNITNFDAMTRQDFTEARRYLQNQAN